MTHLIINAERLNKRIQQLARIGKTSGGGVSRVAFSDVDIEGREFVKELMESVGLSVSTDAVGNIFGRRDGTDASAQPILLGSHIDTVPEGGAFDGALGVLAAIEVALSLAENGVECRHPLDIVAWSDEEGGLSGSRGFVGALPESELDAVVTGGWTLRQGIERVGGDPDKINAVPRPDGSMAAYLELHVEQGGQLEAEQCDIGVVTGIVGIRHYNVVFSGVSNHAGTTPMDRRHNALLGASEFVLAVDRVLRSVEGHHVGTVGDLTVYPGTPNVIPGEVRLTVELRDQDTGKIDDLWNMLEPELNSCATSHGTSARSFLRHSLQGIQTNPVIQQAIAGAAEELELSYCSMPSGAGHDAQNLARMAPTGMIFVPSVGGLSHSPDEYTKPEDVANGAQVLLHALLHIDRNGVTS